MLEIPCKKSNTNGFFYFTNGKVCVMNVKHVFRNSFRKTGDNFKKDRDIKANVYAVNSKLD